MPAAVGAVGDIDGGLDAEAIGRSRPEGAGIGVAEDRLVLVAGDEPGIEIAAALDPAAHLGRVGRLGLERDRAGASHKERRSKRSPPRRPRWRAGPSPPPDRGQQPGEQGLRRRASCRGTGAGIGHCRQRAWIADPRSISCSVEDDPLHASPRAGARAGLKASRASGVSPSEARPRIIWEKKLGSFSR